MKYFIIFIYLLSANASDYTKGKNLFFQNGCSSCHGINAEGSGTNPRLAHKPQSYIIQRLKEFQDGKANTQNGEIMFEFARRIKGRDLQDISYFLENYKAENSTKYEISDDILGSVD